MRGREGGCEGGDGGAREGRGCEGEDGGSEREGRGMRAGEEVSVGSKAKKKKREKTKRVRREEIEVWILRS